MSHINSLLSPSLVINFFRDSNPIHPTLNQPSISGMPFYLFLKGATEGAGIQPTDFSPGVFESLLKGDN